MFLVCGEALFDMFGETAEAEDGPVVFRCVAGGSPYNVAIGLARLGRKAGLATQLFNDELGRRLERALSREGVDLSFVRRSSGATPLALVEIDCGGVPHYAFHGLRELCVHPETPADSYSRFSGLHVGSVPIVSECSSESLLELVSGASDQLISFDPNVRLSVEPDIRRWATQIERFRRRAHLVKVSAEDLEAIHGSNNAELIAASWVGEGTEIVVLTRGDAGCVLFSRQAAPIAVPAAPADVVDTVGAGDSFMAALLCWLDEAGCAREDALGRLSVEQLRSMAEFACVAAAHTCSRQGPDLPRRLELNAGQLAR